MIIAGLRLDTSYDGTDVAPTALRTGLAGGSSADIPTWAHWTVRHPPGYKVVADDCAERSTTC